MSCWFLLCRDFQFSLHTMIVAKALQGGGGDLCKMITPGVHLQQDLHSFSCATVIYINGSHAAYGSHAAKQAYWKYLGPQLPSLNNNNNNKKNPNPKNRGEGTKRFCSPTAGGQENTCGRSRDVTHSSPATVQGSRE